MTEKKKTEYRTNEEGVIEEIDLETGFVINTAPSFAALVDQAHHIDAHLLDQRYVKKYAYNKAIANVIIQKMIEGDSLTKISKLQGMPSYSIMVMWRKQNPEFDSAIDEMRKHRAEWVRDMVADNLDKVPDKEDIPGLKLQFDKIKWLAKVDNPELYSDKVLADSGQAPVKIIIETGVPQADIITEAQIINIGDEDGTEETQSNRRAREHDRSTRPECESIGSKRAEELECEKLGAAKITGGTKEDQSGATGEIE